MLILEAMDQFPKYKQDVYKTITFVSNVDVQAYITHFHNKWYFNEILFFIVYLYVSIVSILLPWAKLKYLYLIKTIESNTQFIPYFTLNWIFWKCTF